ncbi:amidophoribosyltransferase [Cyanidioschyzon merolae strain 10D]|jgi:amidophosphoribosyltransferase|uniref:Amidophosphoribosyltransferase n=1 Tax=Cyanidioschyzon merolae (strain NIES-3377 / 10D) TaxID=280699 RepID=M1VB58_CYAM1|nr:amidophoribosyltransferase [Cyanidioschyzon merolae strain 10D]BAM82469.1 amidophoribosyltransferase [Cyanidioschyzon merolae strain 10D]|eukprot:XP_005538505.1 amidophoribosyltransferase [Cyanidioschyzon merolae strain 10D]
MYITLGTFITPNALFVPKASFEAQAFARGRLDGRWHPAVTRIALRGNRALRQQQVARRSASRWFMGFHDECGVVGVMTPLHKPASDVPARLAYFALHALQHRGQEGAGIVLWEPDSSDAQVSTKGQLREIKGLGLVSEVFTDAILGASRAVAALGHVRYSTAGEKNIRNVQPFTVKMRHGQIAIAHNGNLTNAEALKRELEARGTIFNTSSDTEVILHLMAQSVQGGSADARTRLTDALGRVDGAYSLCVLTAGQLIAVRDPRGFRPLMLGRISETSPATTTGSPPDASMTTWIICSESCALDMVGAETVREIEPGELVVIDRASGNLQSFFPFPRQQRRACIFEHIYFSKVTSNVFGRSVYLSRFRFGELLAQAAPVEKGADYVVPVPDSGIAAALGFSAASGIPFQMGISRSHYVGRTFIQPTQEIRNAGVMLKLTAVRSLIEGKRVVVVDDSIVRGTTSRKIVHMLREAGASEIHLRIACPPIIGSCYYGVDTPNREELLSWRIPDSHKACEWIGADSLGFLSLESLRSFLADESGDYCYGCFNGQYPVLPVDA